MTVFAHRPDLRVFNGSNGGPHSIAPQLAIPKAELPLNMSQPGDPTSVGRATLYRITEHMGNWISLEVNDLSLRIAPYAQYPRALHAEFVPKGKRNRRVFVETYQPRVVVLAGWNHFRPGGMLGKPIHTPYGTATQSSRFRSFDKGWDEEFARDLNEYLLSRPDVKLLADYRGFLD